MCDNLKSLFNHFEILEDSRDIRGKKVWINWYFNYDYYGILNGYTDFDNMADFLFVHKDYFTELLNLKNGTPSYDTLSRVFSIINNQNFLKNIYRVDQWNY